MARLHPQKALQYNVSEIFDQKVESLLDLQIERIEFCGEKDRKKENNCDVMEERRSTLPLKRGEVMRGELRNNAPGFRPESPSLA